jgi:hypothetical protein
VATKNPISTPYWNGFVPCNISVSHGTLASIYRAKLGRQTQAFRCPLYNLTPGLLGLFRFGFWLNHDQSGGDLW